ncbi:hypothetical protein LHK_00734 [Laribacter hongkongensis HLHK9]|uniref:Uncharacterized protein n=1 Tax=Laribacter hongkongensis (strain HLHK9) TaxID=557598 RepID=C1D4D3_LARHH|nr:hypothetical protein LHK_00734 [Laribacter hongkongensis HLHK9]
MDAPGNGAVAGGHHQTSGWPKLHDTTQCPGQPGKPVLRVACRASGRFAGAGQRVLRPALPAADHREGARAVWTFRLPQNVAGRCPERLSCGQPGWLRAGFVFVVARDSGREGTSLIAVLKMHR